jgi:hypothetical protein
MGLVVDVRLFAEGEVQWFDLFPDEVPDPLELLFELRAERKVRHDVMPS